MKRSVVFYYGEMSGEQGVHRRRHPKKDVEPALRYAEQHGWIVRATAAGHKWGVMYCTDRVQPHCRASIWSTPVNPSTFARQLMRRVDGRPHRQEERG